MGQGFSSGNELCLPALESLVAQPNSESPGLERISRPLGSTHGTPRTAELSTARRIARVSSLNPHTHFTDEEGGAQRGGVLAPSLPTPAKEVVAGAGLILVPCILH